MEIYVLYNPPPFPPQLPLLLCIYQYEDELKKENNTYRDTEQQLEEALRQHIGTKLTELGKLRNIALCRMKWLPSPKILKEQLKLSSLITMKAKGYKSSKSFTCIVDIPQNDSIQVLKDSLLTQVEPHHGHGQGTQLDGAFLFQRIPQNLTQTLSL